MEIYELRLKELRKEIRSLNPFTQVKWKFGDRNGRLQGVPGSLNPFTQVKWKFKEILQETYHLRLVLIPSLRSNGNFWSMARFDRELAQQSLNPFTQVKWKFALRPVCNPQQGGCVLIPSLRSNGNFIVEEATE